MGRLSPARLKLEEIFRRVCRLSAETLQVERAGIWLFVHGGRELRCSALYERSRQEFSAGTTLQVGDFPAYFESLRVRKTIPAEHAAVDPRTTELFDSYLAPLGIEAMLDAPILLDGEAIGVVCHEHVQLPREWSTEERDFAGSVADCVALKVKEAEVVESQRIRQLDAERRAAFRERDGIAHLAAGVAHDLRNLLTVVTGCARELTVAGAPPPQVAALAETILGTARRGASVAGQLMELARDHAGHPQVLDVVEAAERVLQLLQQAAGERHRVELAGSSFAGHVFMDPHHFERILLNLVVNARDAMATGGVIRIAVHDGQPGESLPAEHDVVVEVRDTGPGIPPDVLPRIFEPFFTTKPRHEGSGLGLAVVRHLVQLTGGTIEAETSAGEGSVFRMRLPRIAG